MLRLGFATLLCLSAPVLAQRDRPSPEAALKAKLASPFLKKAPWILDWDEAKAAAKKREQLIFGYFTTANY